VTIVRYLYCWGFIRTSALATGKNPADYGLSNFQPSSHAGPNVIDPYPAKKGIDIISSPLGLLATKYPRLSVSFTGGHMGTHVH
jgi:hypothetical protein